MAIWDLLTKPKYTCRVFPHKNRANLHHDDFYNVLSFTTRMLFLKSFLLIAGADTKVDYEEVCALILWLRKPKCHVDVFAYAVEDFRSKPFQFLLGEKETLSIRKDSQVKLQWGIVNDIHLDIRKYAGKYRAQLKPSVTTDVELIHQKEKTFVNFGPIIGSEQKGKLDSAKCWMINIAPRERLKSMVWRWDKHSIELIHKHNLNKHSEEVLNKEIGEVYRNIFSLGCPDHSGPHNQWIELLKNVLCKFGLDHLPKEFAECFIEDFRSFMQTICDSFQEPDNIKENERKKIREFTDDLKKAFIEIDIMSKP